jgi:hypothetical protein
VSDPTPAEEGEQEVFFMCSGCRTPTPAAEIHVIPFWNSDLRRILTTYRCNNCWVAGVEVTRTALNSGDPDVIPSFCDFMALQRFTKDAENLRNGSPDEARRMLNMILDATLDGRAVFDP